MTILFAPFAARAHSLNGSPSPKDYPFFKELLQLLNGHNVIQVAGNDDPKLTDNFHQNLCFDEVSKLINQCDTAICVDSYLQHHMWFLNKKTIVLWGISDPVIFGHDMHVNLLKSRDFLRPNQFDLYYSNQVNPEAFVSPTEVVEALKRL